MYNTDIAKSMCARLSRLTINRHILTSKPGKALFDMLGAVIDNKPAEAESYYHSMYFALLENNARRVSGSLFMDFVLSEVLEKHSVFTDMAAAGFIDEAIHSAMRRELSLLEQLATFDTETAMSFFGTSDGAGNGHGDRISSLADAVWGGKQAQIEAQQTLREQKYMPDLISLHYGETAGFDASDEALCELYARLAQNSGWSGFLEELWNFFAAYGSAEFLHGRLFCFDSNGLYAVKSGRVAADAPVAWKKEKDAVLHNTIMFMQEEKSSNMLITGATADERDSCVLSLMQELPELRLVRVMSANGLKELLELLESQPLRFMLYVDNDCIEWRKTGAFAFAGVMLPENCMLCVSAQNIKATPLVPLAVSLKNPTLEELTEHVMSMLKDKGIMAGISEVRNACSDYQIDTKSQLTYGAAASIADGFCH